MIKQPFTVVLLDTFNGVTTIYYVEAETPVYAEQYAFEHFADYLGVCYDEALHEAQTVAVFPGHHPNCKGQHI